MKSYSTLLIGSLAFALAAAAVPRPYIVFLFADDPGERKNLAAERPEKVKELRARYAALARQAVPPKNPSR